MAGTGGLLQSSSSARAGLFTSRLTHAIGRQGSRGLGALGSASPSSAGGAARHFRSISADRWHAGTVTREYALQERFPGDRWITVSRHPTASAAADAHLGKGDGKPGAVRPRRIVEVDDHEVVPVGKADGRDLSNFEGLSRSKLIATLDAPAREAANG